MQQAPQPTSQPLTRRDLYALAGLLGLTVLFLWRYLFTWPTPLIFPVSTLGTDLPREVWPLWRFMVETLRDTGHVALWRPYLVGGAPVIGHPVAPIFYLPNWIALVLPLPLALNLNAALHLWWASAGTFLILRLHHGTRWEAAFIGGLLFGVTPKWIAHLSGGHWPMMAAVTWWPWAWLGFVRYWATKQARWSALLGFALAMQALNTGQIFVDSGLWLAGCTLGTLRRGSLLAWLRTAAIGWGTALAVMVGLTAGQLWPLLELLPHTTRFALTASEAALGSLPPVLLLAALVPPELKFPEWFLYPGAVTLLLVTLSWTWGWSRRERRWAAGALVGLVMSLGTNTPLYPLLLKIVPGLSLFRVSARWWLFTLFALALIAAWAAERCLDAPNPLKRRRLALAALGTFYLVAAAVKVAAPDLLPFDALPAALALLLAGTLTLLPASRWTLAALVVVLFADLWWTGTRLIRPVPETTLTGSDELDALLEPAAARGERSFAPYGGLEEASVVVHHLRTADGYEPFQIGAYAELVRRASGCDFTDYAVSIPPTRASPEAIDACPQMEPQFDLLALLNVRYVILPEPQDMLAAPLVFSDSGRTVYDIGPGLGRAFGVSDGQVAAPADCVDRLSSVDLSAQALVESRLPFEGSTLPPAVLSREVGANTETFEVRADGAGLLVRSETWAPGWQATIDGAPAEVLRVDCALQGVWLEAGSHEVRFEYAPMTYRVGRWVSLGTLLVLAGTWGWLVWKDREVSNRVA